MRRHKKRGYSVIAVIQFEQNKDFLGDLSGKTSALCEVQGARDSDIAEHFIPGSQRSCIYALVPAI